jgi:carbon monoxide dehydrogenase subunit G
VAVKFDGSFIVATSRAEAYAVLSEMQKFVPLLPTYKSHEMNDDGSADVKVKVGVGKVRGVGTINLVLEESRPLEHARYAGKGKVMGGVFNMGAGFELEELGTDETNVIWSGELTMFGKLVSLAGGLIEPIAKKDIQRLIDTVQVALSGEAEPADLELPDVSVDKEPGPGWLARLFAWPGKLVVMVRDFLRKRK